jgi:hypothetical protein
MLWICIVLDTKIREDGGRIRNSRHSKARREALAKRACERGSFLKLGYCHCGIVPDCRSASRSIDRKAGTRGKAQRGVQLNVIARK